LSRHNDNTDEIQAQGFSGLLYYTQEEASDFDEIFGTVTDYVIDPEECMADNFGYLIVYADDGPDGNGYPDPQIIDGIRQKLLNWE
jgi:hypothetical protein